MRRGPAQDGGPGASARPWDAPGDAGPGHLQNLEGHTEFDIVWPWTRPGGLRPGTTAVLRVKDEAPSLPCVLPPLLRACDHVLRRRQRLHRRHARGGRRDRRGGRAGRTSSPRRRTPSRWPAPAPSTSPSPSGRCTRWRTSTTGASPRCEHPLLVEVGRRHGAHHRGRGVASADLGLAGRRRRSRSSGCRGTGSTSTSDRHGYLDLGLRNAEEWGFPIGPDFVFTKAFEWEIRTTPDRVRSIGLPARAVRRAEVPRRRRVRALDRPGVVRDSATATSASAASGTVFNALRGGDGAPRRARDDGTRGRAHRRPRHPRVAPARPTPARGRLSADVGECRAHGTSADAVPGRRPPAYALR